MSIAAIPSDAQACDDFSYPGPATAWRAMAVLCLASFLLAFDRNILAFVVDPIRADLGISEVQISLLQGLSFALLYAFASLPLGFAADRVSRRNLAAAGVFTWTCAVLAGGFSTGYHQLFASRIVVGLGEASLGPCALSLICDFFPPGRRGRATGLYVAAQAASSGLSMIISGWILGAAQSGRLDFLGLPPLAPWRMIFVLSGSFGFLVAALFFTMSEPARRGPRLMDRAAAGIGATARYFLGGGRRFLVVALAYSIAVAASSAVSVWNVTFLLRRFGMRPSDLGPAYGSVTLAVAVSASLVSGLIVDRIARARIPGGDFLLLTALQLVLGLSAAAAFAPSPIVAIGLLSTILFFAPTMTTAVYAASQRMVPSDMRALAAALIALFGSIIGGAGGPFMVAWVTQHAFRDDRMVGFSISAVIVPCGLIAAAMFFITWLRARRDG
jgi:MFS family permease